MFNGICYLIVLFFIYSVLGYIIEVLDVSIEEGKMNLSRGYFIGPYIPIYAFGALLMIALLTRYKNDLFVLFGMGLLLCCVLEFTTSYLMEKIFKLRWWDYSDRKFNINGRICLANGVGFGIAGVFTVRFIQPFLEKILSKMSILSIDIIAIIFFIVILTDFIISTKTILRLKIDVGKYINKDATAKVKIEVMKSLEKYKVLNKRIFKAFPHITQLAGFKLVLDRVNKINKIKGVLAWTKRKKH